MESDKIDKLLDLYFDGATNLEEEAILLDYFNNRNVSDHLLQYKPIFVGLSAARKERSNREFKLEENKASTTIQSWWYAVAATVVLALGVAGFFFTQPHISQEEKEALMAFENSKKAMILLSENLNKGTKQLLYVNQFSVEKNKIWKESRE